jgi:hypothetical protein
MHEARMAVLNFAGRVGTFLAYMCLGIFSFDDALIVLNTSVTNALIQKLFKIGQS